MDSAFEGDGRARRRLRRACSGADHRSTSEVESPFLLSKQRLDGIAHVHAWAGPARRGFQEHRSLRTAMGHGIGATAAGLMSIAPCPECGHITGKLKAETAPGGEEIQV